MHPFSHTPSSKNRNDDRAKTASFRSFRPAAAMFYTDIQTLRGLDLPIDYGSGVEYADGIVNDLHVSALQIGLWLNGSQGCRDVVSGKLDQNIHQLFDYIVSQESLEHVFLRVGYEFDNYWFGYSDDPAIFQGAFRTMVRICRKRRACQRKVAFVWHSWAAGFVVPPDDQTSQVDVSAAALPKSLSLDDFYPGDDVVDWVGLSLFSQFYNKTNQLGHFNNVMDILDFARLHQKMVMISESTPYGGINHLDDPWSQWFQPVLDLIGNNTNNIGMWSYINCDWESQPMWVNVGFGDSRLTTNRTILKLWQENVLNNPRFVQGPLKCASSSASYIYDASKFDLDYIGPNSPGSIPRFYWMGVVVIALLALCVRFWCSPAKNYIQVGEVEDGGENAGFR